MVGEGMKVSSSLKDTFWGENFLLEVELELGVDVVLFVEKLVDVDVEFNLLGVKLSLFTSELSW